MQDREGTSQRGRQPRAAATTRTRLGRRQAQRLRQPRDLEILPFSGGKLQPPTTVSLTDLSLTGMGLVHDQPMLPGHAFLVAAKRSRDGPSSRLYTVVHCQARDQRYVIGAECNGLVSRRVAA